MELPESIESLTNTETADRFMPVAVAQQVSVNDIISLIKQKLSFQDYKFFEEGLVFYKKDAFSEKNFLKNLCYLYNDIVTKAVATSNITEDTKSGVTKSVTASINSIMQNIDAISTLTSTLNKDKNIIDVQQISYIILGYVIDTIKRANNTKI
jgi:flagellin-specific chaperone FliS